MERQKKMKNLLNRLFQVSLGLLLYLSFWGLTASVSIQGVPPDFMEAFLSHKEQLRNPHVVMAQAIHESSWFSSKIYEENNNAVGMKYPTVRKTVAQHTNRGHATYRNVEDCIVDYILWQNYVLPKYEKARGIVVDTDEEYLQFLRDVHYAEDRFYLQKVRTWLVVVRAEAQF